MPPKVAPSAEVEKLQEQIAVLIVENDTLQAKLTDATFNANDVIQYLKTVVEEKDAEIARLEDTGDRSRTEAGNTLRAERDHHLSVEEALRNEVEMVRAENEIMNTQLGNQHRMQLEMSEMVEKMTAMRRKLDDQEAELKRKAADEGTVRMVAENKVRTELTVEFEQHTKLLKHEYKLQKDGELLMNQRMIERLERELADKQAEVVHVLREMDDIRAQLAAVAKSKEDADQENAKLRSLLEKSSILTEKALRDTKRRLEESERKRVATLTQYNDVVAALKNENAELVERAKQAGLRVSDVEELLVKEQTAREHTVRAHQMQNERLSELRTFLNLALYPSDARNDDLMAENAHALFTRLAVIVAQIPIMTDPNKAARMLHLNALEALNKDAETVEYETALMISKLPADRQFIQKKQYCNQDESLYLVEYAKRIAAAALDWEVDKLAPAVDNRYSNNNSMSSFQNHQNSFNNRNRRGSHNNSGSRGWQERKEKDDGTDRIIEKLQKEAEAEERLLKEDLARLELAKTIVAEMWAERRAGN